MRFPLQALILSACAGLLPGCESDVGPSPDPMPPAAEWTQLIDPDVRLTFHDIFTGMEETIVVGAGGVAFAGDGDRWTPIPVDPPADLLAIHGLPDGSLLVAANAPRFYVRSSGAWRSVPIQGIGGHRSIWGSSQSDVYVAGSQGRVVHATPTGSEWVRVNGDILGGMEFVFGTATDDVYAAGEGGLYRFDGLGWTEIPLGITDPFVAVSSLSTGEFLMISTTSRVYYFDGTNFRIQDEDFGFEVRDAWLTGPDAYFVLGFDGRLLRWEQGGWNSVAAPGFASDCVAAAPSPDGAALLLDRSRSVFRYVDGVTTLRSLIVPAVEAARGIWGVSADEFVVALDSGEFLHREDSRWRLRRLEGFLPRRLWGADLQQLLATGFGSPGLASFDGVEWNAAAVSPVEYEAIHGTGPDHVVAVGNQGTVARFDGQAWSDEKLDTLFPLTAVWTTGPDHILVANRSRRFAAHFDGQAWTDLPSIQPLGGQLVALWGTNADDVTLLMASGAMYRRNVDQWEQVREADDVGVRNAFPLSSSSAVVGTTLGELSIVEGDSLVVFPSPPETRTADVLWAWARDGLLLGGPDGAVWALDD